MILPVLDLDAAFTHTILSKVSPYDCGSPYTTVFNPKNFVILKTKKQNSFWNESTHRLVGGNLFVVGEIGGLDTGGLPFTLFAFRKDVLITLRVKPLSFSLVLFESVRSY